MTHIREHCNAPTNLRKWQDGMLWACDCGQVWRLGVPAFSMYERIRWHKVFVISEKVSE